MRRWNGWGDDSIDKPLTDTARQLLGKLVGQPTPPQDASMETVLACVPKSRLVSHELITQAPLDRLLHAVGHSFPDWVALRSSNIDAFPDGVAYPENSEQVRALLDHARHTGAKIIPYGGGTSVVGHLTIKRGGSPVISVDMRKMNALINLDEKSQLATFGAGIVGQDIEKALAPHGYVLGHFPQSYEYSTLGGWIVTRSSGQQSLKYGRIENLFAGGRLEAPTGTLEIPSIPATGAGNDIREMILGSEGRAGILTEATVKVTPAPEHEAFHAVFFDNWDAAQLAVRTIAHARLPLSMLRLSNVKETMTHLVLAGEEHAKSIEWLERYLYFRKIDGDKCMLMIGITGAKRTCRFALREALRIARKYEGVHAGKAIGKGWAQNRYLGPYFRNSLWEAGYAAETAETCVTWPNVKNAMQALEQAAHDVFAQFNEKVHAFTHLSHVYPQGSSVYSTFIFRAAQDPAETLARWDLLKKALCNAIVEHGGTISHQHGVGLDHKPYLPAEKGGEIGIGGIRTLTRYFDPQTLMNPGKLIDD